MFAKKIIGTHGRVIESIWAKFLMNKNYSQHVSKKSILYNIEIS